jgi:isopentenyldiphosphate isomerase
VTRAADSAAAEFVDVVDDDDRVVDQVTRADIRRRNLLHRAVYILVFNRDGALFVHRRTDSKDVYPGHWDVAIGGVVAAGESYDQAAVRELAEEVGVTGVALEPAGTMRYADAKTRIIGRVFTARHDGPFALQAEEIVEGAFVTVAEAERLLETAQCCPDGAQVLRAHLCVSHDPRSAG